MGFSGLALAVNRKNAEWSRPRYQSGECVLRLGVICHGPIEQRRRVGPIRLRCDGSCSRIVTFVTTFVDGEPFENPYGGLVGGKMIEINETCEPIQSLAFDLVE